MKRVGSFCEYPPDLEARRLVRDYSVALDMICFHSNALQPPVTTQDDAMTHTPLVSRSWVTLDDKYRVTMSDDHGVIICRW